MNENETQDKLPMILLQNISNKFLKRLDKLAAMSYINDEFKDQVWNKDFGFHDLKAKLEGKTITQSQRDQFGANPGGGGSSSY